MPESGDLHSALRVERAGESAGANVRFSLVRLQRGKSDIVGSLHADPQSHTLSGIQTPDLLAYLGFQTGPCAFTAGGQCLVRAVSDPFDVSGFAAAFGQAWPAFESASKEFEACGFHIRQPVGWALSGLGPRRAPEHRPPSSPSGDGHTAPETRRLKAAEDQVFNYVLSWLKGRDDKGWTLHYAPKHPPLTDEIESALAFLGGFRAFAECPEFEFEPCRWRYFHYREDPSGWDRGTEMVHGFFDAHAARFTVGIERLLSAHAAVIPFGMQLLQPSARTATALKGSGRGVSETIPTRPAFKVQGAFTEARGGFKYDVAVSFAGPQRPLADKLARLLKEAGADVFYDDFYPEHLWGKDLPSHFDRVYRKEARFCVVFVSEEYAQRAWTRHELRSALARGLKERGNDYILPVRVEDVDLDGLPPTLGYLSLSQHTIEAIASLLLKKLGQQSS